MALKLIRHVTTVAATDLADDTATGVLLGKLGNGNAFRLSEFGGNDVFVKITNSDDATTVTSSNGLYLRANTTVTLVPEGERSPIIGSDTGARGALNQTDSDGSNAGDIVLLETGFALLLDAAEQSFHLSVINETATNDGAVHVEVVTQANPV